MSVYTQQANTLMEQLPIADQQFVVEFIKKISQNNKLSDTNEIDFRHTFATRMLESNVNIKVLSEILGHKNIQITLDTYAHVLSDAKKENIKILSEILGHKNIQITLDTYAHVLPDTKKDNISKIDNFI